MYSTGEAASFFAHVCKRYTDKMQEDNLLKKVCDHDEELHLDTTAQGSLRHQATRLNISRKLLRSNRVVTSSSRLVLHARDIRKVSNVLIHRYKVRGGRCVCYIESVRYDETPMSLVTTDTMIFELLRADTDDLCEEDREERKMILDGLSQAFSDKAPLS